MKAMLLCGLCVIIGLLGGVARSLRLNTTASWTIIGNWPVMIVAGGVSGCSHRA